MCPKFWLTSVRHNEWLHFLKLTLQKWMGYSCIEGNYLHHSADTCKKVDLLIHALDRPDDHPVMADPTFICVQSKAYLARASRDLLKLLRSREVDKDDKHGPGCRGIEREFVPMVLTVQGSAAPSFWAWWDKAWLRALHRHIATGGTSQDVSVARHQALAALQAVAVRCTTIALLRLQTDPNHPAGRP